MCAWRSWGKVWTISWHEVNYGGGVVPRDRLDRLAESSSRVSKPIQGSYMDRIDVPFLVRDSPS